MSSYNAVTLWNQRAVPGTAGAPTLTVGTQVSVMYPAIGRPIMTAGPCVSMPDSGVDKERPRSAGHLDGLRRSLTSHGSGDSTRSERRRPSA